MLDGHEDATVILIVDDDPGLRELFGEVLKSEGYTVVLAEHAMQALILLSVVRFSLVISDHAMPDRTGGRLIQEIRRRYPDTRTLLMSGDLLLPQLADLAGADRYLQKGAPIAEFVTCVRALLGEGGPAT